MNKQIKKSLSLIIKICLIYFSLYDSEIENMFQTKANTWKIAWSVSYPSNLERVNPDLE